jgi:S-DNA-T family DNA segregation ATPase FtsK/SpoIIIE
MRIQDKVDQNSINNARLDRHSATNPPAFEPGMEDDFAGVFDDVAPMQTGMSSGGMSQPGGVSDMLGGSGQQPYTAGSSWGQPFQTGAPGFGTQQPMQPQMTEAQKIGQEVKDIGAVAGKSALQAVISFGGDLWKSTDELRSARHRTALGMKMLSVTSPIVLAMGIFIIILGRFNTGMGFIFSAVVTFFVGLITMVTNKEQSKIEEAAERNQPVQTYEPPIEESYYDDEYEDSGEGGLFDDEDDDEDSFGSSGSDMDSGFDFGGGFDSPSDEDKDALLDSIDTNKGMMTRQYIFEKVWQILGYVSKDFTDVRVIDEASDEFDSWDAIIRQAADLQKPKSGEDTTYLMSAHETVFFYRLEIYRVQWLKNHEALTKEIVALCTMNRETGMREDGEVYGVSDAAGHSIYVTIMKGDTATVSLKDCYQSVKDWVCDPKNYMPVVMGIDTQGKVVTEDFVAINSLAVAGVPRSGKSWTVQAMLFQLMAYLSPNELHFYFCDPKAEMSDFNGILTPHVKGFESTTEGVLRLLRKVVKDEGPKRQKALGNSGCVNIMDFRKKNPDIDMPFVYVVIDEIMTFSASMDKETKEEFQNLLKELISRLPGAGFRLFVVPHEIRDDVIKKAISNMIPCRISVRGNTDHIENTCGISKKEFPYELIHQGDMAVRIEGRRKVEFVHSVILSLSNDENKSLFTWLRKFWLKVMPESIRGSLYETMKDTLDQQEFLAGAHTGAKLSSEDVVDMWDDM